jgi:hypothetical protein
MLTRLADRIEPGANGDTRIIRYGMWGTTLEIEKIGRKYWIVKGKKKLSSYKTLAEAEVELRALT